jgi:hypothetical protein
MARIPIPVISPSEYESFRSEGSLDLPNTYNEWFKVANDSRAVISRQGDTPVDVPINYDDYIKFVADRSTTSNRKSFYDFALEKMP